MLRKTIVGLVAVTSLLIASAGIASAHDYYNHNHQSHHCHRGGQGYGGGFRGGYGYGGYTPRVIVPARPIYAYPPMVGYGYGMQQGFGPGFGYGNSRTGFAISTPGFGVYFR